MAGYKTQDPHPHPQPQRKGYASDNNNWVLVGFMDFERVGVWRVVGCDKQVHKGYVEVMAVDNLEIKNVGGGEKKERKKEREEKYNGNKESVGGK